MPCSHVVLPELNLVSKSYWKRVTYIDVLRMLDAMEDDPAFRPGMMELDDLSAVTDLAISEADVARFADLMKSLSTRRRRPSKKAVIAPTEATRHAAEAFNQEIGEYPGLEVGIFDTLVAALGFLGIRADALKNGSPERPRRLH